MQNLTSTTLRRAAIALLALSLLAIVAGSRPALADGPDKADLSQFGQRWVHRNADSKVSPPDLKWEKQLESQSPIIIPILRCPVPGVITVKANRDSFITSSRPNSRWGVGFPGFFVGRNDPDWGTVEALIGFPNLGLPRTAVIDRAELKMRFSHCTFGCTGHDFHVYRVIEPWDESVTWATRPNESDIHTGFAIYADQEVWYQSDVTYLLNQANGDISFKIKAAADSTTDHWLAAFFTREQAPANFYGAELTFAWHPE